MEFVTYNIQYSKGIDGRFDLSRVVADVAGADVVALQEVVRNAPGVPDADQPARLAELLEGHHWVYGPALDMDGGAPGVRLQYGNMLLSRWPILSSRLLLFPRVRTFDRAYKQRGALEAVIDAPSGPLRVYSTHLDDLNSRHRRTEIVHLREAVFEAAVAGTALTGEPWQIFDPPLHETPVTADAVVMGDFNMVPGSAEYGLLVGEDDYYNGRQLTGDRLADAWTVVGNDVDSGVTWSDGSVDVRLDYVFVTPGLAGRVTACRIDNDAVGSDHAPVWMTLNA